MRMQERRVLIMEEKLFDSERKVMEVVWERGDIAAREIALILNERTGWNKNTTSMTFRSESNNFSSKS